MELSILDVVGGRCFYDKTAGPSSGGCIWGILRFRTDYLAFMEVTEARGQFWSRVLLGWTITFSFSHKPCRISPHIIRR